MTRQHLRRALFILLGGLLLWPAIASAQEEVVYYHTDAIGSVRAITDHNGDEIARYDYLPFGELWPATPPAPDERRQFAGKERDFETTGLDYFGARYHRPVSGRFTTVDPVWVVDKALVDPQRWNRYSYARNNPYAFIDPDGRAVESLWDLFNVGTGLASLAANVASGNVPGAALDAIGLLADVGATAVPGLPGGASSAIRSWRLAENARVGKAFEAAVLGALGSSKNTGAVSDIATRVTTIPDLPIGAMFGVTDIKNVKNLSFSKQLQAQFAAAQTAGVPFNLIVSPSTQHVSGPLLDAIRATGGQIFVYDQAAGKFSGAVFDKTGNILR